MWVAHIEVGGTRIEEKRGQRQVALVTLKREMKDFRDRGTWEKVKSLNQANITSHDKLGHIKANISLRGVLKPVRKEEKHTT